MRKFFLSLLVLLAAFALQFFFASVGFSFDLSLAALIAFAFLLSWSEVVVFDLVLILILNWQPAISTVLVIYGSFPLVIAILKNIFPWQPRLGVPIAAALGAVLIAILGMPFQLVGFGALSLNILAMVAFSFLAYIVIDYAHG